MPRFHITFETITPESAEQGDAESRGYVHPNGGRDTLELVDNIDDYAFNLRGAVRTLGHVENSGSWFSGTSPAHTDYRTGADTFFSLHPPRTITPASYARLARLLGASAC